MLFRSLEAISAKLLEIGCEIIEGDDEVRVVAKNNQRPTNIKTLPYPGFPTDMQPQMAVTLALADGTSMITESIFENRFKYVDELNRLEAWITVGGKVAVIVGVEELTGAPVKATDLRGGAAMIIAGLVARGSTEIEDIVYIERGYEDVVEKVTALGGDMKRVIVPEVELSKAL